MWLLLLVGVWILLLVVLFLLLPCLFLLLVVLLLVVLLLLLVLWWILVFGIGGGWWLVVGVGHVGLIVVCGVGVVWFVIGGVGVRRGDRNFVSTGVEVIFLWEKEFFVWVAIGRSVGIGQCALVWWGVGLLHGGWWLVCLDAIVLIPRGEGGVVDVLLLWVLWLIECGGIKGRA